jgi:hypothetical protein
MARNVPKHVGMKCSVFICIRRNAFVGVLKMKYLKLHGMNHFKMAQMVSYGWTNTDHAMIAIVGAAH